MPIGSAFGVVRRCDRQGLGGLRPGLGQGDLLGALAGGNGLLVQTAALDAAVRRGRPGLADLIERIGRQRLGAQAELVGLLGRDDADGASPLEPAVEAQLGGENGGERHQDERDDERDAALARASGEGRATLRGGIIRPPRSAGARVPQSLNSMVTSTATGRVHKFSVDEMERFAGGHWLCQA